MNHNISTEELRKMLEDAWEASRKWQQFIRHGSDTTNAPSSSNTYINSILAALDDGQEGEGLRWVKIGERLPEDGDYYTRVINPRLEKIITRISIFHRGKWFIREAEQGERVTEWLDESALPVADGEGEKDEIREALELIVIGVETNIWFPRFTKESDLYIKAKKALTLPSAVTDGVKGDWKDECLNSLGITKEVWEKVHNRVENIKHIFPEGQPTEGKDEK